MAQKYDHSKVEQLVSEVARKIFQDPDSLVRSVIFDPNSETVVLKTRDSEHRLTVPEFFMLYDPLA